MSAAVSRFVNTAVFLYMVIAITTPVAHQLLIEITGTSSSSGHIIGGIDKSETRRIRHLRHIYYQDSLDPRRKRIVDEEVILKRYLTVNDYRIFILAGEKGPKFRAINKQIKDSNFNETAICMTETGKRCFAEECEKAKSEVMIGNQNKFLTSALTYRIKYENSTYFLCANSKGSLAVPVDEMKLETAEQMKRCTWNRSLLQPEQRDNNYHHIRSYFPVTKCKRESGKRKKNCQGSLSTGYLYLKLQRKKKRTNSDATNGNNKPRSTKQYIIGMSFFKDSHDEQLKKKRFHFFIHHNKSYTTTTSLYPNPALENYTVPTLTPATQQPTKKPQRNKNRKGSILHLLSKTQRAKKKRPFKLLLEGGKRGRKGGGLIPSSNHHRRPSMMDQ